MKESALQRQVITYLRERGAYVFKVVGSPYQRVGTPDLLVCWRGRFIGIELKVPGQSATPMQNYEIRKIEEAGGCGAVVWSLGDVAVLLG